MSASLRAPRLTLVINNPQALQLGGAPSHCFDRMGGTIGSRASSWMLNDRAGGVAPRHCEILHQDDGFVVVDHCGRTRLNGQNKPMPRAAIVRLQDADTLHIGPYSLSVHLHDEPHALPDPARVLAQHSIEELLQRPSGPLDDLPLAALEHERPARRAHADWIAYQALAAAYPSCGQLDPLQALEQAFAVSFAESAKGQLPLLPLDDYGSPSPASQADVSATQLEAVHGRPTSDQGVNLMPEQGSDRVSQQILRADTP